jgi:Cleft lip and palate transmembrane protein 1 (CLPTM1)
MYPLAFVKLDDFAPDTFIHPLWDKEAKLAMKVYLSTEAQFGKEFLHADLLPAATTTTIDGNGNEVSTTNDESERNTILLWKEYINRASLSKSFLLSSLSCLAGSAGDGSDNSDDSCTDEEKSDRSLKYARDWLDAQDHALLHDDGSVLSTIQSAGHGIESTSILLTFYQSISKRISSLFTMMIGGRGVSDGPKGEKTENNSLRNKGVLDRSTVHLPSSSPLWSAVVSNSTLYVHVVVVRQHYHLDRPESFNEASVAIGQASRTNSILLGHVDLVKYDEPNHLAKPGRILYHDLVYLFRRYVLMMDEASTGSRPPWDVRVAKPEYSAAYERAQQMKQEGAGYPYWKPEVSIKYLIDHESYPTHLAHVSGMDLVRVQKQRSHPTGIAHIPALHVDEMGMTSDKYIPLNETVTSLPLRITFDRSDIKDEQNIHATTATAGGISPARWRLLTHLSKSIESQRELGFEQSDIDGTCVPMQDGRGRIVMRSLLFY